MTSPAQQLPCGIEECTRLILARGVCKLHYRRWKANKNRVLRYWLPSEPTEQCDTWSGGNFSDGRPCHAWRDIKTRKEYKTHAMRAILMVTSGPLFNPGELEAAHGCHNPICVNPLHGFWATKQENRKGMVPDSVRKFLPN